MTGLNTRTAVVFLTHRFDSLLEERYLHLKRASTAQITAFILAEKGTPVPHSLVPETHFFDFDTIKTRARKTVAEKIIPGSCYLVMLDFYQSHPGFDFYWFIEYDVVFTGQWQTFLAQFGGNDADLLTCHIRTFQEEPDWYWWNTLETPGCTVPQHQMLRALMPICRISAQGFKTLARRVSEGWTGHTEVLVPTVLFEASGKVEDLGGAGLFVAEGRKNRCYTSFSCPKGKMTGLGTVRYQPGQARIFWKSNYLYHPVKPDVYWMRVFWVGLRQALHLFVQSPRRVLLHCLGSVRGLFQGSTEPTDSGHDEVVSQDYRDKHQGRQRKQQ